MNVIWFFAILCGIITAIGVAFLIGAALLDRSNNLGDSKLEARDFASTITYVSSRQLSNTHDMSAFKRYVDTNMDIMKRGQDYRDYAENAIQEDPSALVERHFLSPEEQAAASASVPDDAFSEASAGASSEAPKISYEELKNEGELQVGEVPSVEEPIYEAPTATRPLWENESEDDDFSDFEH